MGEAGTAKWGFFYELTVENVRCFGPPSTLALHRDGKLAKWTVILGDNGVGKTTLLQCLHAMEPSSLPELLPGSSQNCFSRATGWTTWPGQANRTPYEVLAREGRKASVRARLTLDSGLDTVPTESLLVANEWRHGGGRGWHQFALDFEMFACAYGASRKPGKREQDDPAATLFHDDATLLSAEEWFKLYELAAGKHPTDKTRKRVDQIRATLIDLLPEEVDQLELAGLDSDPPRPFLRAHTPFGWVRVNDLSLGYRTLMAWVVDFAARMFARYPESPNPLAEPAVCMVDEIDLHLHPSWQRKLINFLDQRFPRTQFIVTAHSPLVVQAAEDANIAVLRREAGEDFVTIHNDLELTRGWRIDQILTSDLFGLEGSRSPRVNALLRQRAEILAKPELDDVDRERLAALDEQIPRGTNKEDDDAWRLLRTFANRLGSAAEDA